MTDVSLLMVLAEIVGADAVRTDDAARALAANDVHVSGILPLAVVRPADATSLAAAVAAATARGYAVLPRGGGLSYTGGYAPPGLKSITIDLGAMNRILSISAEDMVITVQAGVTWKQIQAALKPLGLRLPFIGTFSGAGATVGGGLGHGALFFGSARYGSAADIVLGMEVALADGTLLRTGQGGLAADSKPFLRSFGPDLTGLFTHDGGMFGIKTEASFRLIEAPSDYGYASFAFADIERAADALSAIARADLAEEVYILDPSAVLGPTGGRWAALNAKVAHSDARPLIAAFDAMIAPHLTEMEEKGVTFTRLVSALANHCFSFEPVFHWRDSWQPIHRAVVDPTHLDACPNRLLTRLRARWWIGCGPRRSRCFGILVRHPTRLGAPIRFERRSPSRPRCC